jgi:hypothetical protein
VVLDVDTPGFLASLLSALLVEVPLAVLAIAMARRLLRLTIGRMMRYERPRSSAQADPAAGPDGQHPARQADQGQNEARKG